MKARSAKCRMRSFPTLRAGGLSTRRGLGCLWNEGKLPPNKSNGCEITDKEPESGMGCLEPRSPPKEIAPDHPAGAICRVQRCTGCPHGLVFPESMPALARRYAELLQLKRTMPLTSWANSSLADEYESIEQTLAQFQSDHVSAEVASWTAKLNSGEIAIHVTYPSY